MHERFQAGRVQPINMEPQSEAITARPESGRRIHAPEWAKKAVRAGGTTALAGLTLFASWACKSENRDVPFNNDPIATPIERTLPPGVATSDPDKTEQPTVIVTPITPITGTEKPNPTPTPGPTDTPTVEPTTPVPTETTVVPTETPSITPTVETPTPTESPTPTETPTVTETPVESELPYEIGFEMTVGNVTLAVTREMQERTECKSPYGGDEMTACPAMHELELNTTDFPDASDKLQEGVKFGLYKAWIEQGQGDKSEREQMTFEDFKAELDNEEGKDLSFQVSGLRRSGDTDVTGLITVDPRKPINFVWIAQPETYSTINNGVQVGIREANNQIYLEIFDFSAAGVGDNRPDYHIPSQYYAATKMEFILAYLSSNTLQTSTPDSSAVKDIVPLIKELDQYLIPSKTSTEWNSILRVK